MGLRKELTETGHDAGPDTLVWHLAHHHGITVSRATVSRHLHARGLVVPEPKKRPKSSYIRFAAEQPNETWQADFTHYRLTRPDGTPGADVEILSWIDDHSRFALSVTAHVRVTGPIVLAEFRRTVCHTRDPGLPVWPAAHRYSTPLRIATWQRLRLIGRPGPGAGVDVGRKGGTVPADDEELAGRPSTLGYNTPAEHERAHYAALEPQEQPQLEAAQEP